MSQYSRLKRTETVETTSKDGKTKVIKVKEHFSNGVTALQKTIAIIGGSLGICTALITLNNYRNGSSNNTSTDTGSQVTSVFNWGWGNNDETADDSTTDEAVIDTTVDTNYGETAAVENVDSTPTVTNEQTPTEETGTVETPALEGVTE